MKNTVLIPAYKPDEKLIDLVSELSEKGLNILIVDDGSGFDFEYIFDEVSKKAEVIHILCNSGKGFALKSGMMHIMNKYPECENIVTADADGQHKCCDIIRVFEELERGSEFVLTVRQFPKDMPARSKFGNKLSRYIYTIMNGHYLVDNQSGLRGFSSGQLSWLVRVDGNKYDYEMNVLYYADKQGITITTLPIEAIYIDNNSSSHFHPVKDTLRIYTRLFYSARVTFAVAFMLEQFLVLISLLFNYEFMNLTIPLLGATGAAMKIILNKFVVLRKFRYRDFIRTIIRTVMRYVVYTLCLLLFKGYMPYIPIFFSFNIVAIIVVPAEYWFYKFMHIIKYPDINR